MHCGLLRDCAGARKAKESLLWYEKKNLDYEERKKEEEWSTVLLSQMAWESCVKAFSHLCSLRSGRKPGKLYIDIHVFIYIYRYMCIYVYQDIAMLWWFASLSPLYWLLCISSGKQRHLKVLHLTWLSYIFPRKKAQFRDHTRLVQAFPSIFLMVIYCIYAAFSSPRSNYFTNIKLTSWQLYQIGKY